MVTAESAGRTMELVGDNTFPIGHPRQACSNETMAMRPNGLMQACSNESPGMHPRSELMEACRNEAMLDYVRRMTASVKYTYSPSNTAIHPGGGGIKPQPSEPEFYCSRSNAVPAKGDTKVGA